MKNSILSIVAGLYVCCGIAMGKEPSVTLRLWPTRTPAEARTLPVKRNNVRCITDVTDPKLHVYPSADDGVHPAVMVCPGGGYNLLAINSEGEEIADWLTSVGFTAVVLEYTVPKDRDAALRDAQRAMGMIRQHCSEWSLDSNRLGVLGFSAGGHLAARLSTTWSSRVYDAVDEADVLSCRPDFTVLIYPAYLGDKDCHLAKEIVVNGQTPPTFTVQAQDDTPYVNSSIAYALALKTAGVPVEQHLYPNGGHGYGLRPSGDAVSHWPELCADWLARQVRR